MIRLFVAIFLSVCMNFQFAVAAQGQVEPAQRISDPPVLLDVEFSGSRVSLNARNAEVSEVLKAVSQKAGIEIFVDQKVRGRVNLQITNATIQDVIEKLAANTAFVYEYLPGSRAYRIVRAAALNSEMPGDENQVEKTPGHRSKQDPEIPPEPLKSGNDNSAGMKPKRPLAQRDRDAKGRPLFKPGELLVKFKPNATGKQIKRLHRAAGTRVLKRIERLRLEKIKLPEGLSETDAIALYRSSAIVESVERHALRYPSMTPNDTFFADQWNLTRIAAPKAWDVSRGSPEVVIAVIDTGVDYLHPELSENIWVNAAEANGLAGIDDDGNGYVDDVSGWDFAGDFAGEGDSDPLDTDPDGHGTHVAGIAAASGNNNLGISGVAWNARIMVLKAQRDGADSLEAFAVVEALLYARDNGAHVVNCSFGAGTFVQAEYDALSELEKSGILAVCAAGNDAVDTDLEENRSYPSGYDLPNIVSVAATGQNDALAGFSNFGAVSVDLAAPGSLIKSTVPGGLYTAASVVSDTDEYPAIGMAFAGLTDEGGVAGLLFECGKGYPDEFPAEVSGNIALVERGKSDAENFYFYQKVQNAQNAGAIGVIIYNCNPVDTENCGLALDSNGGSLGTPGDWVPVVSTSYADGLTLKEKFGTTVSLVNRLSLPAESFSVDSGTSMAAPHVSGTAALLKAFEPGLSGAEIKGAILEAVDVIPALSGRVASGGRLNARNALCSINTSKGDLSCNHVVGLEDAVLALMALSGASPDLCAPCIAKGLDVDGDSRFGLSEAVYILQRVAGTVQVQPF